MASCWITIAQRDMGVFASDDVSPCPMSCRYATKRPVPLTQPHALWINVSFGLLEEFWFHCCEFIFLVSY